MHIYIITNLVNDKHYVGQTTLDPPIQRWNYHLKLARRNISKRDLLITKALRKYGHESFTIEFYKLHAGASQNLLNQMECLAIAKYNSMAPKGYNLKEGGSYGRHAQETKEQISRTQKTHSQAVSKAKKGIPWSVVRRAAHVPKSKKKEENKCP